MIPGNKLKFDCRWLNSGLVYVHLAPRKLHSLLVVKSGERSRCFLTESILHFSGFVESLILQFSY